LLCDRSLKRRERITEQYEYKAVIREGRLVRGNAFKAYVVIEKHLERKVGFIAGKKVGGACDRNRARRVLREAYRHLKPELEPDGFKVVFVAKPTAARLKSQEIRSEMAEMFDENGLLRRGHDET
jgi:ribonuclease P protein component